MTAKIVAEDVSKVFGDDPDRALEMMREGRTKDEILAETGMTVGVQDVSFSVEEGEIFVVMGLSGSGKSTLVRMLNRLIDSTAGSIQIDGEDLLSANAATLRKLRLEKVSMVFQHFALFPHKSVVENVEYGLKVAGIGREERRERALDALKRVGLDAWADRRPNALSGGMQQRVGLARGLAVSPEILLMDEPFSALDPLIRRDMQAELLELQRELKKTIVFITHDLDEALTLGDRIAIMKEGRFVQVGTAEEIVGAPADDYVAAFTQDVDRARVFELESVMEAPHALDLAKDTVRTARRALDELDRSALHVLDRGRLAGAVTYRALSAPGVDDTSGLTEHLVRDVPTAHPETHLYRIYKECAAGLPIAVVDETGVLRGAVTAEAVFGLLSQEMDTPERSANDAGEEPGTAPALSA